MTDNDEMTDKREIMEIRVTADSVHIEDSAFVSKRSFVTILKTIKEVHPECVVFEWRSIFSLAMEWAVHNMLYRLGLWRSRTKDVDLNLPCVAVRLLYCILGVLCWIFIK